MNPIIVIGSGMAAYTLAREFRKLDKDTPLIVITADDGGFYSKPMLSNAFAQRKEIQDLQSQTATQMAAQINASIITHTRVERIDTHRQIVQTHHGDFVYSRLIIAVGANAIRLPIAGNAARRVMSVNHLQDYADFRKALSQAGQHAHVTILGAGLIGCEFADDLSTGGYKVSIVDPNSLPLSALAPKPISQGLLDALASRGIDMHLGTTASSLDQFGKRLEVTLTNGKTIVTDAVLSAVGLRANLGLAQDAGLHVERGIVVNQYGETSTANVYAIGDCAQYQIADGSSRTLPYIAPIMTAARAIAKTLTGTQTSIDLKISPVIVKTPSYSIALVPPSPLQSNGGRWETEQQEESTICRFFSAQGQPTGFAIAPQDAASRTRLLAELNQ